MNRIILACAAASAALALPAMAGELTGFGNLTQSQFKDVSKDLGAVAAYKGVTPATPLGVTGFDLGFEVSATDVQHSDLLRLAGGGDATIYVPKVHLYKGLFAGFDIGGFVGGVSSLDATLFGLDARYAFVDDSLTSPAVAVRISGTRTAGGGDLDVSTYGADLLVSKKFALITPYAGAGVVRVKSVAGNTGLANEQFTTGRGFIGANVNLGVINLAVEAERMSGNSTLSAKAGWRF